MSDSENNTYSRDFIYTCPSKVFKDKSLNATELRIYMMIRSFMDTTGVAYPSNNWIAKELGCTRLTVIRTINKLISKSYLHRIIIDERRHLSIVMPIPEKTALSSIKDDTPPSIKDDTPPSIKDDTQLDQNNITSKINKTFVDLKSTDSYKDDELFMRFYSVYPRKEKPSVARKAFYKCKPTEEFVSMLIDDIYKRIDQNWKNRPKSTIPFPSTYLNSKEWEGEISISETNIKKFTAKTKYKTMDDIMGGVL